MFAEQNERRFQHYSAYVHVYEPLLLHHRLFHRFISLIRSFVRMFVFWCVRCLRYIASFVAHERRALQHFRLFNKNDRRFLLLRLLLSKSFGRTQIEQQENERKRNKFKFAICVFVHWHESEVTQSHMRRKSANSSAMKKHEQTRNSTRRFLHFQRIK